MKKNLKVYAGALVVVGALTAGSAILKTELPKEQYNINSNIAVALDDYQSAVLPEKIELDDGREGYVLPTGYSLYYINEIEPQAGMISVESENADYKVYAGPNSSTLASGETIEVNLDGYVGVKDEYINYLRLLDRLENKAANIKLNEQEQEFLTEVSQFKENVKDVYDNGIKKTSSRN